MEDVKHKIRMDLFYIANMSLLMYGRILGQTVNKILSSGENKRAGAAPNRLLAEDRPLMKGES